MKSKYSFSVKHWTTIFLCFLLSFLTNVVTSDSENVILPKWAAINGFSDSANYAKVLLIVTIAGCMSVLGSIIFAKLCEKKGPKFVIISGLIGSAIFVLLYGTSTNLIVFAIGLIGTICCGQCLGFIGGSAVIANWFPRKKGLAMGFVSVGPPAASVIMVLILPVLINALGVTGGISIISGFLLVMAVLCMLFLHNTPEQVGETPDNLPMNSEAEEEAKTKDASYTTKSLLKNRNLWLIAIIIGICSMAQTGLMAQWLKRYEGTSFEAIAGIMMSACAVIGIFGSMIVGFLENKLGTKKSYVVLAIWFAVAFVFNFTGVQALVYVSTAMFGIVLSLLQIYMPAFEISAFGREGFRQANAIVFPFVSLCGQLAFAVISAVIWIFGEVKYVYLLFAGLLVLSAVLAMLIKFQKNE